MVKIRVYLNFEIFIGVLNFEHFGYFYTRLNYINKQEFVMNIRQFRKNTKPNQQNLQTTNISTKKEKNSGKTSLNGYISTQFHSISLSSQILQHINNYTNKKQPILANYSSKSTQNLQVRHPQINNLIQFTSMNEKENEDSNTKTKTMQKSQLGQTQIQRNQEILQQLKWMEGIYPGLSQQWPIIAPSHLLISSIQLKLDSQIKQIDLIQAQCKKANSNLMNICKKTLSRRRQQQGNMSYILNQAQDLHEWLRKRMLPRQFQQTIVFNIKVVLPQKYENEITENIQRLMYKQMFENKVAKKLCLIVKKNNLSTNDTKAVNDYLKRLSQLEAKYSKVEINKLSNREEEQMMQKTISEIQQLQFLHSNIIQAKCNTQKQINIHKQVLQNYQNEKQKFLIKTNHTISLEYAATHSHYKTPDFYSLIQNQLESHYKKYMDLYNQIYHYQ